MRDKWKEKINEWKKKPNWRDQLYFSFIFLFFLLILISTLIVGGVTRNWKYCYTILMTTPFFVIGKLISILAMRHLTKGAKRSSKNWTIFKSILIFVGVNIIYIIPFFIVWLTVVLNHEAASLENTSVCFNWWILLGWLIFLIIFSSCYTLITNFSWKKQREWWKNQKTH